MVFPIRMYGPNSLSNSRDAGESQDKNSQHGHRHKSDKTEHHMRCAAEFTWAISITSRAAIGHIITTSSVGITKVSPGILTNAISNERGRKGITNTIKPRDRKGAIYAIVSISTLASIGCAATKKLRTTTEATILTRIREASIVFSCTS